MTSPQLSPRQPGRVSRPAETVIPAGMFGVRAKSSICLSSLARPRSLIAAQQPCHRPGPSGRARAEPPARPGGSGGRSLSQPRGSFSPCWENVLSALSTLQPKMKAFSVHQSLASSPT